MSLASCNQIDQTKIHCNKAQIIIKIIKPIETSQMIIETQPETMNFNNQIPIVSPSLLIPSKITVHLRSTSIDEISLICYLTENSQAF
jgi:hypothetical protein